MKKCFLALLILTLMLTMIPVSAFAAEEATEFITIEVSVDTTVREKASQNAKVLSKVKRGGYLISTGSVTNRWGNVWFRVVDPTTGEEGFIYSGKVHEHRCDYRDVDGCDALEFCSCGNIRKTASGMMHTNAYALPVQALDPDVVAAICASGAAIGSAAAAVFPSTTGTLLILSKIPMKKVTFLLSSGITTLRKHLTGLVPTWEDIFSSMHHSWEHSMKACGHKPHAFGLTVI